jgi:hypothetical protein
MFPGMKNLRSKVLVALSSKLSTQWQAAGDAYHHCPVIPVMPIE